MNRLFTWFLLLPLAFAGCGLVVPGTQGSGVKTSETREVGAFTRLRITTVANVEVIHGDVPTLEVTTDDNILPLISTEVSDGELVISSSGSFSSSLGIRVKITASALTRIETGSASQLRVEHATADDLELHLSGASKIDWVGGAKQLRLTSSGASQSTLKGPVNELSIHLSGASTLHGFDAESATATVEASGASTAEINVLGKLDATASGASTIRYAGNPQTKIESRGASTVRAK